VLRFAHSLDVSFSLKMNRGLMAEVEIEGVGGTGDSPACSGAGAGIIPSVIAGVRKPFSSAGVPARSRSKGRSSLSKKCCVPAEIGGSAKKSSPRKMKRSSNTTSTLYLRSTMAVPNINELSLGVSTVLYCQMLQDSMSKIDEDIQRKFDMFNEQAYAELLDMWEVPPPSPPPIETIYRYIKSIFDLAKFTPECNILALVVVNRLVAKNTLAILSGNWRLIVLSALLLAQKVWDDRCLANADFPVIWCAVTGTTATRLDVSAINRMERCLLYSIHFDVTVSASLYAKYYFELRSLVETGNGGCMKLKPLTTAAAVALEVRSARAGKMLRKAAEREASSFFKNKAMTQQTYEMEMEGVRRKGRAVLS